MATFYINPSYAVNGDGTSPALAASPGAAGAFNTWASVTWAAGNTYKQRRATTYSTTLTVGASGTSGSQITLDCYSNDVTGADDNTSLALPIVTSSTGSGIQVTYRSYININNFDARSTQTGSSGSIGIGLAASQHINVTGCNATGLSSGIRLGSASFSGGPSIRSVAITNCTISQTGGAVQDKTGLHFNTSGENATQSLFAIDGVTVTNCTITGYYGIYGFSGGTASVDAEIRNVTISGCTISNCTATGVYFTPQAAAAADFTTANTQCRNIILENSVIHDCGNACVSICSIGGYAFGNTIYGANSAGFGTTGGAQFICQNYVIYDNEVYNNTTNSSFDGCGIFLDVNTAFTSTHTGCTNVVVWRNFCHGNLGGTVQTWAQYNSTWGPDYVTLPASGIRTYGATNCLIVGNICDGNACGIGLDGFSSQMTVVHNTCVNNTISGISLAWGLYSSNNLIRNNILSGNLYNIISGTYQTFAGEAAGTLTLGSGAIGGGVTATSTTTDFTNHNVNYGIRETGGNGFAWIYSKASNTQVTVQILRAFSSTSLAPGAWEKNQGYSFDAYLAGTNLFFNPGTANILQGAIGTAPTIKGSDIQADPTLEVFTYRPLAGSAAQAAGASLGNFLDYYGFIYYYPPSIGAVEVLHTRTTR